MMMKMFTSCRPTDRVKQRENVYNPVDQPTDRVKLRGNVYNYSIFHVFMQLSSAHDCKVLSSNHSILVTVANG